jgi:hypothetical protein
LYVSQGATLVAFGCGDRHPLPVVLAPCSAGSSSALYDDLGDAFNDGSNAGRKVSNSSAIISHPKSETSNLIPVAIMPDTMITCLQSIPLLPINLHAAKLWVEIDGRDMSKMNR